VKTCFLNCFNGGDIVIDLNPHPRPVLIQRGVVVVFFYGLFFFSFLFLVCVSEFF